MNNYFYLVYNLYRSLWVRSSPGRAPPWHGGGSEFDPRRIHQIVENPPKICTSVVQLNGGFIMGLFHKKWQTIEERFFPHSLEDVKKGYLDVLENKMKAHHFKQLSENVYKCKTSISLKFNMNPGRAEITFSEKDGGTSIEIKVHVSQLYFYKTDEWVKDGFNFLEESLS